jgi:hypothetical protein
MWVFLGGLCKIIWYHSLCSVSWVPAQLPPPSHSSVLQTEAVGRFETVNTRLHGVTSRKTEFLMILGKWPTWRTILSYVFIFNSLYVSSTSCSSSGETNCVSTTSGSCRWPCRVQIGSELPTCTQHGHQHRVTVTRGCIDTICLSWWWARCARNM